ncbi:LysR family transcriptional regulator [Phaeobacter italicus]|uniref:LysR family transcriptional regulator n=1 Tax=Phaeobacter italicus TaxID=481446 RepID=UPI000669F741|nr:LysR family transcriptional regulator [Phaeobacter italicus]CRL16637.1 Gcv operon activator [Phaeobacter italicus]SFH26963.1 transcriptional regulator, LysR family [Phaeobacter italicus]
MARRKLPPMNALVAFEAAARHGSFTRAAEDLSVAQPAVTRHIARLEDWIGAPLFLRRGNQIRLTAEGETLAELATSVLDRLEVGLQDVAPVNDQELRIGASFGVTHLWLMPRIGAMRAAANVTINFITSDDYRSFDDRAIDCSIRFGNGDFGDNAADLLFLETCQIVASPEFLANHPTFDPDRPIATLDPALLFDHGDPHLNGWITWARFYEREGQSLPSGQRLRTVLSYPSMLDIICAGEGIGLGYWGLEDQMVQDGRLVRVGPALSRPHYGYYLVYRPDMTAKPAFQRLRTYLMGAA